MGLLMPAYFNVWKASRESSESDTHSDFLLAPSLARCSFNGWAICAKPFMKLPVIVYKAKEGSNLHIGLQQHAFSDNL